MSIRLTQLDVYRTAIPMRPFEHAAASRDVAEAIVVRAAFSAGPSGWGETLPREYVTGETLETVAADLEQVVWPAARELDFAAGLDVLLNLPAACPDGRCLNAAVAAIEIACADAHLSRSGSRLTRSPVRRIAARVSGVLGSADPDRTARRLRRMRCFGLRDFKLKLGVAEADDAENLRRVHERIGKAVAAGRCTLRVDVNGAWDADSTPERVAALRPFGVSVVEQPTRCDAAELVHLARRCELPLMADESLLTAADARSLLAEPQRIWWNVRLSKNGGLRRSMRLIEMAAEAGVAVVNGCMVGESSILSAAQRRLLEWAGPRVRHAEGNYGRFLLADDLTRRSLRFGYGGRLQPPAGAGLGVEVDPRKLERRATLLASLRA